MNALTVAFFACLVAYTSAGVLGAGYAGFEHLGYAAHAVPTGPVTIVGASGVVGPNGAAGPSGVVTGHGSVGPSGEHNAIHAPIGGLGLAYGGLGLAHGGLGLAHEGLGLAHGGFGLAHGGLGLAHGGLGLGAAVVAPATHAGFVGPSAHSTIVRPSAHAAFIAPAAASYVGGHGLALGHGYGHGPW